MNSENESDCIMSSISADHLSMPILLPPGNQNTTTTSSNMSQTSNELMEHDEAVENDEAMENDEPVDVNLDKNVCSSIFQILKQYELEVSFERTLVITLLIENVISYISIFICTQSKSKLKVND